MAKYAKRGKKRGGSRRRRRIGAAPKLDIQTMGLQIGGAILASKLQGMLSKDPTKTLLVNIAPFIGLGAGIVLPMFVKNQLVKDLATGMVIQGGVSAIKKFAPGLVGNFAMVPVVNGPSRQILNREYRPALNGVGSTNLPETSVYDDPMAVISGIAGFSPNGSGSAYAG